MTANGRRFNGFLVATEPSLSIPRAFFTDVLPSITDLAELQVTLTVFRLCDDVGGIDQPLPETQIRRDRALRSALRVSGSPREPDQRIDTGLELAVARGALLRFSTETPAGERRWYYVHTPANQALVDAMAKGVVAPPEALWQDGQAPAIQPERPNVFRLYEQNIGLLTPIVADQLVGAMDIYPTDWIEEAIGEATGYNRRSWRYIQRILEKWAVEGRQSFGGVTERTTTRNRT